MNDRRKMARVLGIDNAGERSGKNVRTAAQQDAELKRLARENKDLWERMAELQKDLNKILGKQ